SSAWNIAQLWLAVWYGRTCRLYTLSSRVEAIKIKLRFLAMDERQLTTAVTALPTLTTIVITNDAAEPHPSSQPDAAS
ncbi:hypothetical protein BGY98DRAFT_1009775, partial [Russula aff. rugulosa BPL654]